MTMQKIMAIFLNGEGLKEELTSEALKDADVIVAADGGANYCLQHGIQPDYIIGDLDSIHFKNTEVVQQSKWLEIRDQNSTDLEKALKLAERLQPDRLRVLNASGKRSDHALANLLFLAQFNEKIPVEVVDNFGRWKFLTAGYHRLSLPTGRTVSFVSVSALKNLTLHGFKFPLKNASFERFFVGISNVVTQTPCTVSFEEGRLMMYEVERFD